MRTYGAYVLGLPDFATYTQGHHESERYLALVLPKIADFDHRAAPDVRLSNAHHH